MSTLDDLVKKYGSSSTPAKKKKNTSTTGLDGLYNKLGLETPEYSYSNPYESDPYALAVDEAYNRVNNSNLLSSAEDRRQLSAREKYAQRNNESNRQRNNYRTELSKPTVQKDTSPIGELEDRLLEEKKRTNYTPAQKAERDRRESEYQDYAELQKLNNLLNDDNENWFTNGKDYDEVKRQRDELQFKVDSSSQRDKQEAWDNEYQQRMSAAMTAADFSEKSKPDYSSLDPTYLQINEGKMKKDDIEGYVNTYLSPELKDKDAWLDSLDVSSGVKSRIKAEAERRSTEKTYDTDYNYNPTNKSNSGEGTERYEYLTRDEKRVYNYLHSQSAEKADEFLDFLWDTLGERLAEAERQEIENFTKALPGVSDIVSVPLNLVGGATGLVDLAKQTANHWLTGAPIDTNSAAMRFASTGQEIRNVRSQQFENLAPNANVLGINVLSGLYNTVMSGLDSAAAGYVGAGVSEVFNGTTKVAQGITEAILSGTAATQAARDVKARGGNDNQILLGALSAGIFEALFENLSIETLPAFAEVPWNGWRSVASNVTKSFITNASEEMNTELANILFDTFAMGSVSEYADSLRKYMAEGLSFEDAKKQVIRDFAVRVGESGVSGGIMGAGFGITSSLQGRSAARQTGHALQTDADRSAFNALLADGLSADKSSELGKLARDIKAKIDAKQSVSDLDVGRLYNLTYAEETESAPQNAYNEYERASADMQRQAGKSEIEASRWANIGDELAADTFRDQAQQYRTMSDVTKQFGLSLPTIQSQAQADFLARRNVENQNAYTPAEREAARSAAEYNANLALQNEAQNNIIKAQQTAESAENNAALSEGATLAEARNAAQANAEPHTVTPRRLELPTVKESTNGREVYLRNGGERVNGENTGEQVRAVEESAGRNPRRQTLGLARDGESSNLTYERKAVSTKELTGSGSDNATIYRVTDGNTQYTKKASEMAKAANVKAVFFGGDNLHMDGVSARGMIDGDTIYIRVDHPQFTADRLMGHELGHKLIREGKVDIGAIRDKIAELVGQRSSDWFLGEYRQRYNGIKDSTQRMAQAYADAYEGADMTDAEIWEEIVCDALGDMNAFAGDRTMTDSTRGIVDQYLAEIKNQAETQQTRAPPGELSQDVINDIQHDRPIDTADEVKASREFDSKYQEKAEKKNKSLGFVAEDIMVKAGKQRAQVKEWLDAIADKLPPDVLGSTWIKDESYGGTEELTTVCIRSIGAHMLMDAIADKLGRPLNVIETTRISQAIFDYTDKPECLYCYVAMDRKAYREYLGSYIEQRDAFIKDIKDGKPAGIKTGKVDTDSAYGRFLGDRKNTSNMQDRARLWLNTYNSGAEFITAKDLANTENLMAAAERSSNAEKQVIDATAYAQSASWAKKQISYAAYNNHVLRWSQKAIDKLNSHYGMRFYSFSDYSPAFLLENMQMVTDAAVRGLKGLGYTKEIDFAKAFAPTGMNINCSVFAYKDKATGEYLCDGMQGADWEEVKALRKKYPNVGAVLVATDDAQVEWALEQDWIDVIIPFHMVRTGSVVANYFGWKNYTAMSRDVANDKNAEVKSITPPMHQNNKELYLAKCKEYNLTPRFKQWVDHPNYMRLVNETRQSEGETSPMQPIFDLTGAKASIDAMVKQGGYAPPIGGSLENMLDIADEMAGKIKEGKPLGKLEEARESSVKYSREFTPTAEDTAYLNAVNSGDMETAQKMVDEAAKKAGYKTRAWHQTAKDFTVFNTDNPVAALNDSETPNGIFFKTNNHDIGLEGKKQMGMYLRLGNTLDFKTREEANKWYRDHIDGYDNISKQMESAIKPINDEMERIEGQMFTDSTTDAEYDRLDNEWNKLLEKLRVTEDKYRGQLRNLLNDYFLKNNSGYNSIHLGYDGHRYVDGKRENVETYIVFSNTQAKSADPVTYDDNGNVIPLSERFNEKNEDIRYSREFTDGDAPVSQAISSAKTSIKQIPALFKDKGVAFGKVNVDIGGGRFDLATDYLKSIGTKNLVFDPYNRSEDVNSATLKYLQDGNKADTATCANVLNVIKEADARANVILEAAKAIKEDGKAYFMVYEGDGSGVGRETSSGWQNNRKTADYVDEISKYFDNVERHGKLITASEPKANLPKAAWETTPGKATMFSREFDADLFDVNEDIRKRIADIQDELARTKRHEMYWKGQMRRTTNKTVREADINKLAKRLIKNYSSTLDVADIAGDLQALGNYIVNNGDAKNELTYEDLRDRADAISKKIVENALAESEGNDAGSYRELRSYLRDQTLRLPAENKADLIDYAAFKKANPALKVSTKSGLEVDAAYMELQSKLGKAFLPDDITNPADQLMRIADVVNELKPVYDNPYDYQQAEAIEYISSDILDSLLSEEVRQTPPTFADRKAAEIERVRGNYKQKIVALQEQAQQHVDNLRVRKNEQIEALKEYYAEQKQEARERRADADARTKLLKIARRLNNKKLPLVMKAQLAQYIGELDLVAKSMTGKTLDKLTALKDWYETQKEELGEDFIKDEAIEKKLDRLSKKRINDLTASEVADLTQVLQFFEASIIEANKFKNSKIKEDRYAAGMRVVWDVQNARPGKINWQLRPSSAAMRMVGYDDTSPLATAMDEMIEGERQYDLYQREAVKPYEKWINNKRFMKSFSGKDARMLTIKGTGVNGNEVTQQLTPAMLVEMYLASRNEDNMRHYQRGYAVFPNMELYRKGDIDEAYNKTNKVSIKRSAILEAAKQLTQEELAFASAITNYYNNFAPKRLNETSLIIDGYEKFNEENYYPIVSDNKFLNQDYESLDEKGNNSSLAQPGFGKERTHASNPAIVRDANLTLMQQIRMNGRYATMAIPLQNMSRLLNVKGKGMTTSVREALTNQYSSSADAYLKKFMRDYAGQNAAKERGLDPILKKIRSSYAGGVLALSAGTAIKQAASYPTAAAVTGAAPLLKAMNLAMKADVSFIDELTAAFTKRTQGFSSMELGDLASINKSLPKALNWIQAVDVGTTKLLKRAAYFAVRSESPNLKVGSDGFKQAVVNKYVEIIEKTQPNYSVALRPEVLRSNSEIVRTISMFMTQPLQNYNILYDAFGNYAAKKAAWQNTHTAGAKAALNDAKKQVIRATSSQFVAALVFALMQFGWDRLRGKDKKYKEDGKLTLGSFAKGTGLNMLTSGAGMFVGGKTALELAESIADGIIKNAGGDTFFDQSFYGLESAELGAITDAGKAALNLTKLVGDIVKKSATGEDIDWEASVRKLLTGAGSIGVMFGVPVDNVTKDVQAFARSILHTMGNISGDPVKGDFLAKRIVDSEASEYYDQLYKYYKTDRDKFAEYYNLMLKYKVSTADKIKEKMEKLMREDAGVPGVKDLEKRFLVGEEEKTYDELMSVAEKGKLRWKGSTEGQAIAWKKAKEFAYDIATGDEDAEAKAQAAGVSYEDYISALLALGGEDKPTGDNKDKYGTYSQDEITAAVNSLTGLTRQERYTLWQALSGSDTDKNNPFRGNAPVKKNLKASTKTETAEEKTEEKPSTIDTSGSSMFSSATYKDGTLSLKFRGSGKTYTYNVPESVWEDMKNADSLGNFYNSRIKGKYSAA